MPITLSEIIVNRAYGNVEARKIRERHVDHLSNEFFKQYIRSTNFADQAEVDAILAISANAIEISSIQQEIARGVISYENGTDPLHEEVSENNWQKVTPSYQTWEELAKAVTINFLERTEQLELVSISSIVVRISGNDKKLLWGMTNTEVNSVNAAIQVAVDTRASLDSYSPYFNEGVKV